MSTSFESFGFRAKPRGLDLYFQMFREAKQTEIEKFLGSAALKALPRNLKPDPREAMKMRMGIVRMPRHRSTV